MSFSLLFFYFSNKCSLFYFSKRNQPDLLFQQFRAKKRIERLRKQYLYRILSRMRRSVLDIPEDASEDDYLNLNSPQVETADLQGNAEKDLVFTS